MGRDGAYDGRSRFTVEVGETGDGGGSVGRLTSRKSKKGKFSYYTDQNPSPIFYKGNRQLRVICYNFK